MKKKEAKQTSDRLLFKQKEGSPRKSPHKISIIITIIGILCGLWGGCKVFLSEDNEELVELIRTFISDKAQTVHTKMRVELKEVIKEALFEFEKEKQNHADRHANTKSACCGTRKFDAHTAKSNN